MFVAKNILKRVVLKNKSHPVVHLLRVKLVTNKMAEGSWSEKLSKLLNEDLRISTLNEIKENFEALPHTEASRIAQNLQLPLVFDCLNDSNS